MNTKKRIYLIRHGQTDYNKNGIVQGSGIDSSLNELGKWQAEQFFRAYHHVTFDCIFTSNLRRTQESVQPFLNQGIKKQSLSGLNEISWGIYEGVKSTPEEHKHYLQIIKKWKNGILDIAVEGGETPLEMQTRQRQALDQISRAPGKNILVSTHGRAMRSLLCLMTNTHLKEMDKFGHSNLCLYILNYDGDFEIQEANNTEHLKV